MVFYPGTLDGPYEPDPRSLYLAEGYPLPPPVKMSLRKGEMLVFNPELLHATHLNTTSITHLALSARINPARPRFSQSCFYAREFWHSSSNIESGVYDRVLRFTRDENLETASPREIHNPSLPEVIAFDTDRVANHWQQVCDRRRLRFGTKVHLQFGNERVLLMRTADGLRACQANCPHLGVSLADGHQDGQRMFCPAHGVSYDLETGESSCPILRLRIYEIEERDEMVWLRAKAQVQVDAAA